MQERPGICFEKGKDGVAIITLNRPEKLNAFTHSMIADWVAFLNEASNDPSVKVLMLTGKGRGFCTGGDLDEMGERGKTDAMIRKDFTWRHVHKIAFSIERMEKPIIAAVNGMAVGAGSDMALMCDIRLAAESASFSWSYVNLNLVAGDGGTYYLPRIIGMARALELFWTGRAVGAREAERIGLVSRTVPDAELQETALDLARVIASKPQDAVRFYRRAAYQGETQTLYSHLDMLSSHMAVLRGTEEHVARVEGFRGQRRKARAGKNKE